MLVLSWACDKPSVWRDFPSRLRHMPGTGWYIRQRCRLETVNVKLVSRAGAGPVRCRMQVPGGGALDGISTLVNHTIRELDSNNGDLLLFAIRGCCNMALSPLLPRSKEWSARLTEGQEQKAQFELISC
ncbi:hypothetical protein NDU88_008563 [Pleurodeles waltl]|uniref:Uncharacterized protein n=1 Tax=Pleurodeles waltl TaxID=8319 RepID=A0AAV7PSE5_PLEWA|nr:hypothetical protein NDU88_008563 [Pleurodeles waltl]